MRATVRLWSVLVLVALASLTSTGCESPTSADSADDSLNVDDIITDTVSPSPASASLSTDGKTYRVVRGNNQPDEILPYAWKASFTVTLTINSNATEEDIDLTFPVKLTQATVTVQQASGGIIIPPGSGDVEHYDSVITGATANQFGAVDANLSVGFDVWYSLPSGKAEGLVTVSFYFKDSSESPKSFTKVVTV